MGSITQRQDNAFTIVQNAWNFYPADLAQARHKADAIIIGRVLEVRQAADIVVKGDDLPNGEHREPNQRITFQVLKHLRGNVGSQLTLWHFGDSTMVYEDDPHYELDEQYVLFVEAMAEEPGTYSIVAPPGRYRVVNNRLELMPGVDKNVPFATALRGKPISALEQALAQDEATNN